MRSSLRLLVRAQEGSKVLQTAQRSKPSLAASSEVSEDVRDFQEIPSPPSWPLIGHLLAFMKHGERLDKHFADLQAEYGDMVRMKVPTANGNNNMLLLFITEHFKSIYTNEERIPKLPGWLE